MSSLQIGLAIAGGLVLAAVVAYNAWVARRNVPRQATAPLPDPLADASGAPGGRQEPVFDGGLASLPQVERRPSLDALIDVFANLSLDNGLVSGDAALAAMPPTRRAGSKPYAIEGLSEATGSWETPQPGQRYSAFQAGVQLANRTGALNEIEFSEFVMKTQAFADSVGASPEFPDMRDEVARARELDQFASSHDAQLSFTLHARSAAWSPGFVAQHAARSGFVAGTLPGRMALSASEPGLPAILNLSFDTQAALAEDPALSAIRQVRLSLDVPQVARSEQPFVRLRTVAADLAQAMEGMITDDQGQPLDTDTMDAIGADLEELYDRLESHELAAGSDLARRLFS